MVGIQFECVPQLCWVLSSQCGNAKSGGTCGRSLDHWGVPAEGNKIVLTGPLVSPHKKVASYRSKAGPSVPHRCFLSVAYMVEEINNLYGPVL